MKVEYLCQLTSNAYFVLSSFAFVVKIICSVVGYLDPCQF